MDIFKDSKVVVALIGTGTAIITQFIKQIPIEASTGFFFGIISALALLQFFTPKDRRTTYTPDNYQDLKIQMSPLHNNDASRIGEYLSSDDYMVNLTFTLEENLPRNHEIWLITQPVNSNGELEFFPQCDRAPANLNLQTGLWEAQTYIRKNSTCDVFAVVTPPTSQEFFRYYCKVGRNSNNDFIHLEKIPSECKVISEGVRIRG